MLLAYMQLYYLKEHHLKLGYHQNNLLFYRIL